MGMINRTTAGQGRITADYQVDTGRRVCEGSACTAFMAHVPQPVTGFLTVVAVGIPEDRLPGVPVQAGQPAPPARLTAADPAARHALAHGEPWTPGALRPGQVLAGRLPAGLFRLRLHGAGTARTRTQHSGSGEQQAHPPHRHERTAKPGDPVIDAIGDNHTRHVVIFEKCNEVAHRSYTAYEQRSVHGTSHRTVAYGLAAGSEYKAYRPLQ
ncbi:hypothetical protein GCM10010297_22680 [Streptomyces malachitofuscus]|nr:hypothetical protein GCM10010297_22680 [Streptomyces malachitofuscus]